tara:strand:- start:187 stop:1356 length:1170 start_codon:yes stop_codon:yes gene_type:complete
MSDAFKNYDSLLSSLNAANMEQRNVNTTLHQTKAGIDSTAKILGETKMFLSGKPALQKISKNIAKPLYEKYGKEFVDNKIQSLKNKLGFESKETPKPSGSPEGLNDNTTGTSNKPEVNDFEETPEETNDRLLGEQNLRETRLAREENIYQEDTARSGEVNDLVEKGAQRSRLFEKRVGSGDAEGEELIDPIKQMKNPFADNLDDYRNSNLTDFSQPKSSFTAEDLGAKGVDQSYDRTTGLTDAETQTLRDYSNVGLNPNELSATSTEALTKTSGTFQNSMAQQRASVQPNVKEDAQTPPKEDEKDEKDLADGDEEVAAGDDAAIAGGEAGTGILDAIPGLDILGAIGGAVLAGIMSHREKMQEKAEQAVAPLTTNVDTQIGLSGSEALS